MLMALALLAAIDAVPTPVVSLTLTGETDRPPVSATPRSLSDVARELRAGRKAVGGFSAVESTVPQSRSVFVPALEPEPEETEREPEVVTEVPPVYVVPTYVPAWFGRHQRIGRHQQHTSAQLAAPRPQARHPRRPSAPLSPLSHITAGAFRQP